MNLQNNLFKISKIKNFINIFKLNLNLNKNLI
jgi:hypothetical protein